MRTRMLLPVAAALVVLAIAPRGAAAAVGQILRVEGGQVVVGYAAGTDLTPGSLVEVRKLFREGKVQARANVVAVDRVMSMLTLRFEGPATREPIVLNDYVEVRVLKPGAVAASAGQPPRTPTTVRRPSSSLPTMRYPLDR